MKPAKKHLALALALLAVSAAPALADEDGFEPNADMGYAFELQNWSAPTSAGAVGFTAFMHTLTLTDRSGLIFALANSAAKTNANRYYAEQSAIAKKELFYEYQQVIDEPKEGVRLGLVLGTGSPNGFNGPGVTSPTDLDAKLARMRIDFDMFALLGGTVGFHTGLDYFQAGSSAGKLSAFTFPLGLAWRIAPLPVPGLLFEPFVDADLGTAIGGGFKTAPARNYGLRVNYFLHPSLAINARVEGAALPLDGSFAFTKGQYADVKIGSLGAQLIF
jgi:hypothetical protein